MRSILPQRIWIHSGLHGKYPKQTRSWKGKSLFRLWEKNLKPESLKGEIQTQKRYITCHICWSFTPGKSIILFSWKFCLFSIDLWYVYLPVSQRVFWQLTVGLVVAGHIFNELLDLLYIHFQCWFQILDQNRNQPGNGKTTKMILKNVHNI